MKPATPAISARNQPTRRRPVVLVTGASAGLGLCLAKRLLAQDRYNLVLTARASSLERFAAAGIEQGSAVMLAPLDVVDDAQRREVIDAVRERWQGVDILINNAGVAIRAVVEHVTEAERIAQMRVNFIGPMDLIRLCLPYMRAQRAGRIINISSVSGMMAMPTMAVYSASKFALEGATEALWYEVRPFGVRVTLVQPGFINSSSFENTRYTQMSKEANDNHALAYSAHYHYMGTFIAKMMRIAPSTPEQVAQVILRVMERRSPPLRVAGTWDARFFGLLRRLLPRVIYHALLYRLLPGISRWAQPAP